jgi:hypothetical protein
LPVGVRGSASTKSALRGALKRAIRCRTYPMTSSASSVVEVLIVDPGHRSVHWLALAGDQ